MDIFENKNILITGGCGSIGQVLIDKILEYSPNVIRIFDINEEGLYNMHQKYKKYTNIRYLLGNVCDKDRIQRACEDIDLIIHTAALKHVFFGEYNPFEVMKTNILGTQNVIDAALSNEVEKAIFTSSDKAVNPTNVMGTTKLFSEQLFSAANLYRGKREIIFSTLRFGNVLGSSGSVINLFYNQIKNKVPLTITDPKMTRYIMTIPEAVNFTVNAINTAQGGEIFISKMKSIKIYDLAKTMIEYYAEDSSSLEIKNIGKIIGEKIYEELLTENEKIRTLETKDMYIIQSQFIEINENIKYNAKPIKNIPLNSSEEPQLKKDELLSLIKNVINTGERM